MLMYYPAALLFAEEAIERSAALGGTYSTTHQEPPNLIIITPASVEQSETRKLP